MALGDKKISSVFNTGAGNAKTVSATQEARIKASFEDGTYIQDQGMLENLGPMIYGLQKVEEDIEELRRFVAAELTTYNPNDISTWQRKYDRFSLVNEEATPEGIFFKPDGTKMYIVGRSGDDVDEYALSTAWDITTASYTDQLSGLNSSPASESNPTGIYMSPDGIYLYITGHTVDQIIQYTMSVAWDVSTATYTREQGLTYNSGSQLVNPDGIDFKSDGTILFAISRDRDVIQSYNLSTAWDVSTISEHQSFSLIDFFDHNMMATPAGTSDIGSAYDMRVSQDGTKIWIVDSSYDTVSQLDLSTAFDITTVAYSGTTSRITPYESYITGLYVAESVNKAFSVSSSGDYVRSFDFGAPTFSTTNNASYSFLTGLGVKGDLTVSQGIINATGIINTSSTYLYSTLEHHGTASLGHNNGGRVNLVDGNTYSSDSTIDMMTNLRWGSNSNSQSTQDTYNHSINIGKPFSGTKLTVNIGRRMETDGTLKYHSGLMEVYSDAQFIDHKGRLKVGQNLQVDGVSFEQLEAYDLGGTVIFNDTFTESSDTNLDSHTPDTGAGWTLAYNTTIRTSQVKGGQGHLRMSGDDSSDGIFYLCDTLPTTQDYEVKVDWSRQDNSNDTLSIIIKYKDANNFLALQWSGSYDYCRLTKIQGGALSDIDPNGTNPFRYGAPTTTTDGDTGSLKLRFIDGKMMVWNIDPQGTISFRGSWDVDSNFHDNDGDEGTFYKFGLGFGEIFSTQGFDATNVWKITNFQVKQLSAASTYNTAQKHYINNGNFGVGITNPTSKFHVVGDARIQGNLTVNGTYTQIDTDVNTTEQWLVTNDGTGPAAVINQKGSQDIFDVQDDGTSVFYIEDGGNVGIGTTSPAAKLHTIPSGSIGWSSLGNAGILIGTDTGAGIGIDQNEIASKGDHLYLGTVTTDKDLILRAGGATNRLVVKGDTGNVGIGTASPSEKLEVDGNIKIGDSDVVKIGDGNDFTATHDGTDTFLGNNTGDLYITQQADDKDIIFRSDDGSGGVTEYFRVDGGSEKTIYTKPISLLDSVGLQLGTGTDAQIYHTGSEGTFINYTGNFRFIQSADNADISFYSDDGSGGTAEYFMLDGSLADGSNYYTKWPDNSIASFGSAPDLLIYHDGFNSRIRQLTASNLIIENLGDDKDIIFKCDDGSGGVAEYFRLDGALGYTRFWKHLRLEDNVELRVGTSSHGITLVHDGSDSTITNAIGDLTITNFQDDGDIIFKSDDGSGGTTEYFRVDGGDEKVIFSKDVDVTGNISLTGSVQKQISTTHHTININSSTGSTQDFWIPFIEKNEQPTPNITHRTVAPYDGVLKRVIVHSTVAFASNAQIRFHKINNGSAKVFANDNSTDDVTTNVTADMSTAYTSVAFNFTSNNDFRTGDQIGLGIVRNNTAVGDVAITAVWEYELF